MQDKNNEGKWITVNGKHIFVLEGETPDDAFDRTFYGSKKSSNADAIKEYELAYKRYSQIASNAQEGGSYERERSSNMLDKLATLYEKAYPDKVNKKTMDAFKSLDKNDSVYPHGSRFVSVRFNGGKLTLNYYNPSTQSIKDGAVTDGTAKAMLDRAGLKFNRGAKATHYASSTVIDFSDVTLKERPYK